MVGRDWNGGRVVHLQQTKMTEKASQYIFFAIAHDPCGSERRIRTFLLVWPVREKSCAVLLFFGPWSTPSLLPRSLSCYLHSGDPLSVLDTRSQGG
jgi:hypothetical protein